MRPPNATCSSRVNHTQTWALKPALDLGCPLTPRETPALQMPGGAEGHGANRRGRMGEAGSRHSLARTRAGRAAAHGRGCAACALCLWALGPRPFFSLKGNFRASLRPKTGMPRAGRERTAGIPGALPLGQGQQGFLSRKSRRISPGQPPCALPPGSRGPERRKCGGLPGPFPVPGSPAPERLRTQDCTPDPLALCIRRSASSETQRIPFTCLTGLAKIKWEKCYKY